MYSSVLIVDDTHIDRFITETIIKKNMFARHIKSCSSVQEGLHYLRSLIDTPDMLPEVIFLDVNMPILDGFDFLDGFLKLPADVQSRCAIYMISATNSPDDLQRIGTYPVIRRFFNKPLTVEILDFVRKHIDSGMAH